MDHFPLELEMGKNFHPNHTQHNIVVKLANIVGPIVNSNDNFLGGANQVGIKFGDKFIMDKEIIIEKLRKFLQNHSKFEEECEAIYLMVEIRKILDYKEKSYKTLRFYCNWVLHKELSQEKTTKLLSDIFEPNVDLKKDGRENARNIKSIGKDFFMLKTFRKELGEFFKDHELPMDLLRKNWWTFGKLLLEIIKDCPVYFVANKIRELKIEKNDDRSYSYKFSLINSKQKLVEKLKLKKK